MFTGLVEGQGVVRNIRREDAGVRLEIEVPPEFTGGGEIGDGKLGGRRLGDSVAICGCCLTVVELQPQLELSSRSGDSRQNHAGQTHDRRPRQSRAILAGGRTFGRSFRAGPCRRCRAGGEY